LFFNSLEFLIFLPAFMAAYFATRGRARIAVCLAGSYLFYGWWDWRFLALIILVTLVNFAVGTALGRTDDQRKRKRLLIVSCIVNLGVLGVFKYFNFFIESTESILGAVGLDTGSGHLNIILPVGISFYTFQAMSYSIDVYRRRIPVERDLMRFAAYVALFPQLVAGPIVRASDLLPQMAVDQRPTFDRIQAGFGLVLLGMFKKVVVADNCAPIVDSIFSQPDLFTSLNVLLGVYLYAVQIYCDFSGYTDIAIGIGRMLGFEFPENFNKPYFSASFSEFWTRWHISLSTWLRDYLYIPLGGNRKGAIFTYRNLMLTMLLGGLWHGAAWTFVFWGFLHGVYLMLQRWLAAPFEKLTEALRIPRSIVRVFLVLLVFHLTCFAWIFFRAQSFDQAMHILERIGSFDGCRPLALKQLLDLARAVALAGSLIGCELVALRFSIVPMLKKSAVLSIITGCVLIWLVLLLGNFAGQSFIYFQF